MILAPAGWGCGRQIGFLWKFLFGFGFGQGGRLCSGRFRLAWRGRVLTFGGGAGFQEVVESAGVLAIQRCFVALQQVERTRGIGQTLEGKRSNNGRIAGFLVLLCHFHLQQTGVDGPIAHELPSGDGHGFYQRGLIGGTGLEFFDEGVHQFVEEGRGFGGEYDAAGELAVAERVLRRGLLALFGDGSGGALCVGAVGLDLTFGCHSFWVGGRVRSEGMIGAAARDGGMARPQ